jgi:hypothetical protein
MKTIIRRVTMRMMPVMLALGLALSAVGGTLVEHPDRRPVPDSRISVQLWTVPEEFTPSLSLEQGTPPPASLLLPAVQSVPPSADTKD